ncbi:MAG: DUF5808 domain-containing protein [Clostridia bacterium]|nr:DUF5808 domain-containing protein [Clostridia bacterium]
MKTFMLLFMLLPQLSLLVIFAFTPYFTRKTESFGVSIPKDVYHLPQVVSIRSRYKNNVLITGILLLAAAFILILLDQTEKTEILISLSIVVQLVLGGVFYLSGHKKMKALKSESNWTQDKKQVTVIDTDFRSKKMLVSPLWFLLYGIVISFTAALTVIFYDRMPDRLPMQFNITGEITRWAGKSLLSVSWPLIIQIFITVLLIFVYWIIRKSKQQIEAENPEISMKQNQMFRYKWSAFIVITGLALITIFMFIPLSHAGFVGYASFSIVSAVLTIGIIVYAIILSVKTGQGGSRIKIGQDKESDFINRDDDKYWKMGVFYYNPDDPALFIEKRFGIGWTCNFARPLSWVFIIGLLVFVTISIIASSYMTK